MPQTGYCTELTCHKELTELYECHCCNWLICLKHLLEHVEVTKKEKKKQLDNLRNELTSVSSTLELIVEKKIQEIEREKQLINQAKTKLNTSGCSVEEIQEIFEQINQVIASNGTEETIVKVESSLADIKPCLYMDEISPEKMLIPNAHSSPMNILQRNKTPVRRTLRYHPNGSEKSTPAKSNDSASGSNNFIIHDITLDSTKDEAHDVEAHGQENAMGSTSLYMQCPLTFDGAFGLTEAKHSMGLCLLDRSQKRNLQCHFIQKHKFKMIHARRLFHATRNGLDPMTTKLFSGNEVVIDHDRFIPCPFSSRMINLIGCCPQNSQNIPCQFESIDELHLKVHLIKYHRITAGKANKIKKNYKVELAKIKSSNGIANYCC